MQVYGKDCRSDDMSFGYIDTFNVINVILSKKQMTKQPHFLHISHFTLLESQKK